jgi:hypothetical protein
MTQRDISVRKSAEVLWKGTLQGKGRVLTMAADAAAALGFRLLRLLTLSASCSGRKCGGGATEFYSVGERKSGAAARVLS